MIVGIDATNIRVGGGVAHLKGILQCVPFDAFQISKIVVWGDPATLRQLPDHTCISKVASASVKTPVLEKLHWQFLGLAREASVAGCDVLLIPGGIYLGSFRPFVAMVQNMQVFEWRELRREGISKITLRLLMLQVLQGLTFLRANGILFLSNYCREYFGRHFPWLLRDKRIAIIPHGIVMTSMRKEIKPLGSFSEKNPQTILYVSTVKNYKHHWNLIDGVGILRRRGFPVELSLVGGGDKGATRKMRAAIDRNRDVGGYVHYHGDQSHESTLKFFEAADLFAFPSTCETFGISLLEAMSYGLPIACSRYGPMPELLGDAGVYFDPLDSDSIASSLQELLLDLELQKRLSGTAITRAKTYTWSECSTATFGLLQEAWKQA